MPQSKGDTATIAIVGPCGAGKSTLAAHLEAEGFRAHQIAQEHSFVPDMWKKLSAPDILIYLDATYEACQSRKHLNWNEADYAEQLRRLQHARTHCDIYLDTSTLTPEAIAKKALAALKNTLSI